MPISKTNELFRRGGFAWGLQSFDRDLLVQFISDIENRERHGLSQQQCYAVRKSLENLVTQTTVIVAEGGFLSNIFNKPLFELLEDFSRIYQEWNSDDHIHEEVEKCYHRQIKVKELRKCRYRIRKKELRISKKIKYDQHVIDNELDLKTITSLYECFNALCKEAPGIFKNLSKALARYSSRKN